MSRQRTEERRAADGGTTGGIIAEHTLDEARNYPPRNTKTPPEGGV